MAGLVVGFPFDTGKSLLLYLTISPESKNTILVKVRFQSPHTAQKYHSTIHAVATIVREEKFIGLYKGISSPLVSKFPPKSNKRSSSYGRLQ